NGKAQPIFEYTPKDQKNGDSGAIRFCVYVETDYDTDGDGKLDLIKALVQLPHEVLSGMKVATIYEARPYITCCNTMNPEKNYGTENFDISSMYHQPARREPNGTLTTAAAAKAANPDDWYYEDTVEGGMMYEDLDWYDYYLVRGFGIVECGGIGTKGSQGFETCGSDLELDAFKCVIEWLNGDADRIAYTNKEDNIAISADWSNHNIGMTGRSYAGTTQFGLATTGVEGLKTVVPVAGIASWYDYTNSQGLSTNGEANYTETLAWYCNGRFQDEADYATIATPYGNYLNQLRIDQVALNGDYGPHWQGRDYTLNGSGIKCPALIVHGLNDENVRTKQFDMMYNAFTKAGQNTKLLLHQGTHVTPTQSGKGELYIGDQLYDDILNKWFSHYLYGVENGIENMPTVTAQNNVDGNWSYYDTWTESTREVVLSGKGAYETATTVVNSDLKTNNIKSWKTDFTAGPTACSAMYTMDVAEDMRITGPVAVHVKASADVSRDPLQMSAMLVERSETDFPTFTADDYYLPVSVLQKNGAWMGGGVANYDLIKYDQTPAKYKIIAQGWADMNNPAAGYESKSSSVEQKITLVPGENQDYTIYLQPSLYTVKAGHKLSLVIFPS
ncbi:MAG: CocE/NonD family hydrolase, partial [Oscillospiraceae bacterium]